MKVPVSRFMAAGDPFKDGAEITRDELRFARFIMRLQSQFAIAIKNTFITHLKLKELWKEYNIKEQAIQIKFNEPTSFMAMRNQQLLKLKFDSYATATQGEAISKSYAQKYYLEFTADMMRENREWLRKDAALAWELAKITELGPNFREQLAAQAGGEAVEGGGGGGESLLGGGGGPGAEGIPSFGGGEVPGGTPAETPPTGETPTPPAGGAPTPPAETPPA